MKFIMKLPISAIILTYNEELNIENCLKSISDWVSEIFIIDSFSNDKTLEIAEKYGAKISQHPFKNQAEQFNWALDNLKIKSDWILRLDADEKITKELWQEIAEVLPKTSSEITGFYIKRRVYFMDQWIKHGGYYPAWFLRLWRFGAGRFEERQMDEHLILSYGKALKLKNDFIETDKKDLSCWIIKHNNYATREAKAILDKANYQIQTSLTGFQAERKRWFKEKFYNRLPLFIRACFYFSYRYFLRGGFLDGKQGLIFHFLQGFWYRFLVDSKLYEYQKKSTKNNF